MIIATVIGFVSHAAVMAIAQTVNAPYPSLLPSTNADEAAPAPMLGTKSAIAPAIAPSPDVATPGLAKANPGFAKADPGFAKGSAAGASRGDFKPVGRTTAQALFSPSTIIAVGVIGGLVALATAGVSGGNNVSGASSTN